MRFMFSAYKNTLFAVQTIDNRQGYVQEKERVEQKCGNSVYLWVMLGSTF